MKKVILLTALGLTLVSAAAYGQMQHRPQSEDSQGGMQMPHHGRSMGQAMMHGGMHGKHQGATPGGGHQGGSHGASSQAGAFTPKGDTGPSSLAFHGINRKMHEGMDIPFTGNADVDFVKGMIPHHQGAIDMAKTVLAFGKDPQVRKLAEEVIKAQEGEIIQMQDWLKKNGQ